LTKFQKLKYVEPEMENLRHKKNTCEEKNIFLPKNFKVQDTTKRV
jgi:hypothetical protein